MALVTLARVKGSASPGKAARKHPRVARVGAQPPEHLGLHAREPELHRPLAEHRHQGLALELAHRVGPGERQK
jgi:hypothetical protein